MTRPAVSTQENSTVSAPLNPIGTPRSLSNDPNYSIPSTVDNTSLLQPPINPVLLAQMHLQKLGINDCLSDPTSIPFSSVTSSETVTNNMIHHYLQQISQAPDVDTSKVSSILFPQHHLPSSSLQMPTSSIHLSGLLQQSSVAVSSFSDGPQRSKLLQWTQPNTGSHSGSTTPPFCDDKPFQAVDPVSAKWGVIAAPRLSPTPAEFRPGVPWKSRTDTFDNQELRHENINQKKNVSRVMNTTSTVTSNVTSSILVSTVNKFQQDRLSRKTPPGLQNVEPKSRQENQLCWLTLKGITSAVSSVYFIS